MILNEMNDCIFCTIAAHRAPAAIIYEDDATMAFLDIHPSARGHTLVIPREHYENIFDLREAAGAAVMATTEKVARALRCKLNPEGLNLMQANGRAAGQSVFHFHFHLIPRTFGDQLPVPRHPTETADMNELQALAAAVRESLFIHE